MVGFQGVRYQDIFQGGALLADLQVAVSVGALEVVIALYPPGVVALVEVDGFFREDQHAAWLQRGVEPGQQGFAFFRRKKLQGEVENHHARGLIIEGADIAFDDLDGVPGALDSQGFPGTFDHGRRDIHRGEAEGIRR